MNAFIKILKEQQKGLSNAFEQPLDSIWGPSTCLQHALRTRVNNLVKAVNNPLEAFSKAPNRFFKALNMPLETFGRGLFNAFEHLKDVFLKQFKRPSKGL